MDTVELRMSDSYCRECGDSASAQLQQCCSDRLRETFDTVLSVVAGLCQRNTDQHDALVELIQYHELGCMWTDDECPEPVEPDDEECINCKALRAAGYLDDEEES
jgi:hypothetical protein